MPNICNNTLSIKFNDEEYIDKIEKKLLRLDSGSYILDFELVSPIPFLLNLTEGNTNSFIKKILYKINKYIYGYTSWYQWCVDNWGTKWNAMDSSAQLDDEGKDLFISFDTARSPPIDYYNKLYNELSKIDPDIYIRATYSEEGMQFYGEWINGQDNEYIMSSIYYSDLLETYVSNEDINFNAELFEEAVGEVITLEKAIKELTKLSKKHGTKMSAKKEIYLLNESLG